MKKARMTAASQYIYVNSLKRRAGETTSLMTVAIPAGVLTCKGDAEYFTIQCVNFQLPRAWPWMHANNNMMRVSPNGGASWISVAVPVANYLSFQAMLRAANLAIAAAVPGCFIAFNANTNRCRVSVPSAAYVWNPMTIAPVLGFDWTQYTGAVAHASPYTCVPFPTTQLNLCVLGVTPADANMGTSVSTVTEPVNHIVSLPLQLTAPGDIINYNTNSTDVFYIKIKEKDITSLTFVLKDENDDQFTGADADASSEYNAVIRIDTVREDTTQHAILRALDSAVDYLRLIFVGPHLK